jgi:hypothetical protein
VRCDTARSSVIAEDFESGLYGTGIASIKSGRFLFGRQPVALNGQTSVVLDLIGNPEIPIPALL